MQFVYVGVVFLLLQTNVYCSGMYGSWAGNTLHCRNNEFKPVDWWYIYKPPSGIHYMVDDGRNFSYITSEEFGKWTAPQVSIMTNSMLQHTLSPLYKRTYDKHMGGIMYSSTNETIANGLLVTDIVGGFWLMHTIPNFPDLKDNLATLPRKQLPNGHLIMCMSVQYVQQKKLYDMILQAKPKVKGIFLSNIFYRNLIPEPSTAKDKSKNIKTAVLPILNNNNPILMVRPPGNHECLYKKFARDRSIILDVYGRNVNNKYLTTVCSQQYGLRNIESISFKHDNQEVHYLSDRLDHSKWAVSTAAHWQQRGSGAIAYWTCLGTVTKEDMSGKGAVLFCIHNYGIWLSFDKLKVAEPECYT